MPRVVLPFRFLVDYDFFEESIVPQPSSLLHAMMVITVNSKHYKKKHNLMSVKLRDRAIDRGVSGAEYIKAGLNAAEDPSDIESIDDEVVRTIKYALAYSEEGVNPDNSITKVCILTSDAKKETYLNSTHLKGITNVVVKSGQEARDLIISSRDMCWDRN